MKSKIFVVGNFAVAAVPTTRPQTEATTSCNVARGCGFCTNKHCVLLYLLRVMNNARWSEFSMGSYIFQDTVVDQKLDHVHAYGELGENCKKA